MKISKLLIEKALGVPIESLENRQTGTSTGYMLKIIGDAMVSPGIEVLICEPGSSIIQNINLADRIRGLISKLELKFFIINTSNLRLLYLPAIEIG